MRDVFLISALYQNLSFFSTISSLHPEEPEVPETRKSKVTFDKSCQTTQTEILPVFEEHPIQRDRDFIMFVHGGESRKPVISEAPKSTIKTSFQAQIRNPNHNIRQAPSLFLSPPPSDPNESFLVRKKVNSSSEKTEIIPVKRHVISPSPEKSYERKKSEENKTTYYTDRNFTSKFLDDSVPLSQMIVSKK